jgi:hypothetical protein
MFQTFEPGVNLSKPDARRALGGRKRRVTIVKKSCLKLFTIVASGSMMSTLAEEIFLRAKPKTTTERKHHGH